MLNRCIKGKAGGKLEKGHDQGFKKACQFEVNPLECFKMLHASPHIKSTDSP